MKYLNKILETNEITPDMREKAERLYLEAKSRTENLPLTFGEDAQLITKRKGQGMFYHQTDHS